MVLGVFFIFMGFGGFLSTVGLNEITCLPVIWNYKGGLSNTKYVKWNQKKPESQILRW